MRFLISGREFESLDPNRKHSRLARVSKVENQKFNSIRLIDFDNKKLQSS
jgi:hypothetical protein